MKTPLRPTIDVGTVFLLFIFGGIGAAMLYVVFTSITF